MARKPDLDAVLKQKSALELRKGGATYEQIATKLEYANHSGAYKAVQKAMKSLVREEAEDLRRLEDARLDQMLLGLWTSASRGDPQAVDRVLKIMDRRAKLWNLDTPTKQTDDASGELKVIVEYVDDAVAATPPAARGSTPSPE